MSISADFEASVRIHEERFEPVQALLRPGVKEAIAEFLDCRIRQGGFARLNFQAS